MTEYSSIKLDYIKAMADGDPDFEMEIIRTRITTIAAQLEEIGQAISDNNRESVGFIAHKMRCSFLMIGNNEAATLLEQLEFNEQLDRQQLVSIAHTVGAIFDHARPELHHALATLANASEV